MATSSSSSHATVLTTAQSQAHPITPTNLLLVHPSGLSLASLPRIKTNTTLTSAGLPFPSRFPHATTPRISTSAHGGSVYLWYEGGGVVWEYDARGRRISEFSAGRAGEGEREGGIKEVSGLGRVNGRETVLVAEAGAGGVGVWEKAEGGKWSCINRLEVSANTLALELESC